MISKDELFQVLRDQNYWFRDIKLDYIPRDTYLTKLKGSMSSKSIIAVKGPRRSGKTVLLKLLIQRLLEDKTDKEQILYVNLEDYRLYPEYSLNLLEMILEVYRGKINPDKKTFFLIDEIQNILGFEHFLRTKYDEDKSIKFVITGSNSRLLSKELGTLLTGRVSTIEVFPFSFEEYLFYRGIAIREKRYEYLEPEKNIFAKHFSRFIEFGAIPEFLDEEEPFPRLNEYLDNVLFRDIIERFKIRNIKLIKELSIYLLTNNSKIFSINQLSRAFKVSINTIQEYLQNLNLAYLFFYLDRFSFSAKERVTSQSKVYCIDAGIVNGVGINFSKNTGRLLENVVFIELLRNNKEVYYFSDSKKECDFVIKDRLKVVEAIQVTKSMKDETTRERELKGLIAALSTFKLKRGIILTEDEFSDEQSSNFEIKIRPVWFWLLNKETV